ncbi:hypothetical protein GMMP1_50029 [Candidatus Magnetomoraceae bacterium gMMP-1]
MKKFSIFLILFVVIGSSAICYSATDYQVLSLQSNTLNPIEGENIEFEVEIINNGPDPGSPTLKWKLFESGVLSDSTEITIVSLSQNETITQIVNYPVHYSNITVIAECNELSDSDNNNDSAMINVDINKSDLNIQNVRWETDWGNNFPVVNHHPVTFYADIMNNNDGGTTDPFNVNFTIIDQSNNSEVHQITVTVDDDIMYISTTSSASPYTVTTVSVAWTPTSLTNVPGNYTLKVEVDKNNDIEEINDTNNDESNIIAIIPQPDYVISDFSHQPIYPIENDQVTFTATVTNNGGQSFEDSTLLWEITKPDSIGLTKTNTIGSLISGESKSLTFTLIGTDVQFYTTTVRVTSDAYSAIVESAEGNNYTELSINIEKPDMQVNDIRWSADPFEDGDNVTFYADIENLNTKGGTAQSFNVEFTLTKISDGSVAYTSTESITSVGLGESLSVTPTTTWEASPGTYSITVKVSIPDKDDSNNISSESFTIYAPSLEIVNIDLETWIDEDDKSIAEEQPITFSAQIKNNGGGSIKEFKVKFIVEKNGTSIYEYTATVLGGIDSNYTETVKSGTPVWIPTTIGPHNVKVEAWEEGYNSVNNNLGINVIGKPNYIVASIKKISPLNPIKGNDVVFEAEVKNQGGDSINQSKLHWYICTTGSCPDPYTTWTKVKDTDIIEPLLSNATSESILYTLTNIDGGTTEVIAVCDADNDIVEKIETDNISEIVSIEIESPDLIVSNIEWTPTWITSEAPIRSVIPDGQSVTLSALIENNGPGGGTNLSFGVAFTVTDSSSGSTVYSDNIQINESVEVGWSKAIEASVPYISNSAGNYIITVEVDNNKNVNEDDEGNNISSKSAEVLERPDYEVSLTADSYNPVEESDVTFTAKVKNLGEEAFEYTETKLKWYVKKETGWEFQQETSIAKLTNYTNTGAEAIKIFTLSNITTDVTQVKVECNANEAVGDIINTNDQDSVNISVIEKPDYVVSFLTPPITQLEGNPVSFTATIENIGGSSPARPNLRWYVRMNESDPWGVHKKEIFIDILDNNKGPVNAVFEWPASYGTMYVKADCDVGDEIAEGTEVNNFAETSVVINNPDLQIRSTISWTASPEISGQSFPAVIGSGSIPVVGQDVSFSAEIENIGSGGTIDSFDVVFKVINDSGITEASITKTVNTGIPFGSALIAEVESDDLWSAEPGNYNIKVELILPEGMEDSGATGDNVVSQAFTIVEPVLDISDIKWDLSEPVDGQEITFSAVITNNGGKTIKDFDVVFTVDDSWTYTVTQQGIVDTSIEVDSYSKWTATSNPANHTITVKLSGETYYEGVTRIESFVVLGKPDYLVSSLTLDPEKPIQGDDVTFTATIKNQGGPASSESTLKWYVCEGEEDYCVESNGDLIWGHFSVRQSNNVIALGNEAEKNITFDLLVSPGTIIIVAVCDADDDIVESNEENNLENDDNNKVQLPVKEPALSIDNISWIPDPVVVRQDIMFYAQITNSETTGGKSREDLHILFTIDEGTEDEVVIGNFIAEFSDNDTFDPGEIIYVNSVGTWTATGDSEDHTITVKAYGKDYNTLTEEVNFSVIDRPDYELTNLTYTPETQIEGDNIVFTAVVQNTGAESLRSSKLYWYMCNGDESTCGKTWGHDDNNTDVSWTNWTQLKGTDSVTALENGEEEVETISLEMEFGEIRVRAICDAEHAVVERGETVDTTTWHLNNVRETGPINMLKPDLKLSNIRWEPTWPVVGEDVTFYADIYNVGDGGTAQDFEVSFTIQGDKTEDELGFDTTYNLALDTEKVKDSVLSGDTTTPIASVSSKTWEAIPGNYTIVVEVAFTSSDDTYTYEDELTNNSESLFITGLAGNDYSIAYPDLIVGDVWWEPSSYTELVDGQEVTFYARIDNIGEGGLTQNFEVEFLINGETLGKETVKDDSLFPHRELIEAFNGTALSSGDTENYTLVGWTLISGSVGMEDRCDSTACEYSIVNRYYVHLSGSNTVFQSPSFSPFKSDNSLEELLEFTAYTSGSGTKRLVIRELESDEILFSKTYSDKTPWRIYVINLKEILSANYKLSEDDIDNLDDVEDLSRDTITALDDLEEKGYETLDEFIKALKTTIGSDELDLYKEVILEYAAFKYNGEDIYLELRTEDSSNATFMVDNFRMGDMGSGEIFVSMPSTGTWTAIPGDYSIAVQVDNKEEINEANEDNNEKSMKILHSDGTAIGYADYTITSLEYSPYTQIQGRDVDLTALIKNNGYSTLRESEVQWLVKHETDTNWSTKEKDKISGLAQGEIYTATYALETQYGTSGVKIILDAGEDILELNDEDNTYTTYVTTPKPDLIVGDIWWSPVSPVDGEEVTFYAKIDNIGIGGTNEDFEVSFKVKDENDNIEEIGSGKVKDEVMLAQRTLIFPYGAFASGYSETKMLPDGATDSVSGSYSWTVEAGGTFSVEEHDYMENYSGFCDSYTSQCQTEGISNKYYIQLYGNNTILRSPVLNLDDDLFEFIAQTDGSGQKLLRVCRAYTDCEISGNQLIEKEYSERSTWRAYIVDISKINEPFFLELETTGSTNASFMVDEFRMLKSDPSGYTVMVSVTSKGTWTAGPGIYTVTAKVDSGGSDDGDVLESDEDNNERSETILNPDGETVGKADYEATLDCSPVEQIEGREIDFTALITNTGSSTLVESELEWFVKDIDKGTWDSKKTENITGANNSSGLANGEIYTGTLSLDAEYGTIEVKVECDTENTINEEGDDAINDRNNTNNTAKASTSITQSDLVVGDIWWEPSPLEDGQDVTFYARIDNIASGGTVEDFEVQFILDENLVDENGLSLVEDLGTASVSDDIMFARRSLIPVSDSEPDPITSNGGFENNDLSGWEVVSGAVFVQRYDYVEAYDEFCAEYDQHCENERLTTTYYNRIYDDNFCTDNPDECTEKVINNYYVRLYGSNTILRSESFALTGNSLIFRGKTSGSGTKSLLLREMSGSEPSDADPILVDNTYKEKSPWRAYVIDISNYTDKTAYIEVKTETAGNAEFIIDDFRMAETPYESVVVSVASHQNWKVTPGFHTITVVVDAKENVEELTNGENDNEQRLIKPIGADPDAITDLTAAKADYELTKDMISHSPLEPMQGRDIIFKAAIKNKGKSTHRESRINWYIRKTGEGQEFSDTTVFTEVISGLTLNETYTSIYTMPLEYFKYDEFASGEGSYTMWVKVKIDADSEISESSETNNIIDDYLVPINKPDLVVSDVWWVPEDPLDGEEVSIYAMIENRGKGGTTEDFEVQFKVDEGDVLREQDLDLTLVQDDVHCALRELIPVDGNGGFEKGDLSGWSVLYGSVSVRNRSDDDDTDTFKDHIKNKYYADLMGTKTVLHSDSFIPDAPSLVFTGKIAGSGTKTLRVCRGEPGETDCDECFSQTYDEKTPWRAYVADLSQCQGESVYVELKTEGASAAEFIVDDFRMSYPETEGVELGIVKSAKKWVASPGEHEVWVKVDSTGILAEKDEYNNLASDILEYSQITMNIETHADYEISSFTYDPKEQVQGRVITFTAVIKNSGYTTLVDSSLGWYTCEGDKIYCEDDESKWEIQQVNIIKAMVSGETYTAIYAMPLSYIESTTSTFIEESYTIQVRARSDYENQIDESSESNNEQSAAIGVQKPDLQVGEIWCTPIDPMDGDNVTFYARIDNYGGGGTTQDFDVNFIVDDDVIEVDEEGTETKVEVDLGTVQVLDDVPFGKRQSLPILPTFDEDMLGSNGDFELGKLTRWTKISGSASIEKHCEYDDSLCSIIDNDSDNNVYYARLYGANTLVRSSIFTYGGKSLIFRAKTDGSGTKKLILRKAINSDTYASDDPVLVEKTYDATSTWEVYVVDISDYDSNVNGYIELKTEDDISAEFMVDDFRMRGTEGGNESVVSIAALGTWTANPGSHTVTVNVDSKNLMAESDEDNNENTKVISRESGDSIGKADYTIEIPSYSPLEQVQGRDINVTGLIKNLSPENATRVESSLKWYVCQGSEEYCEPEIRPLGSQWSLESTQKISGLNQSGSEGDSYTAVFEMNTVYDRDLESSDSSSFTIMVLAECDAEDTIDEGTSSSDAENNNYTYTSINITHPDFTLGDIWWSPASPVDGDNVTFYAEVKNIGTGGTIKSFDVSFIVDKESFTMDTEGNTTELQVDLGETTVKNETLLAQRELPFTNAGFESGDLSNWETVSGSVFMETRYEEKDEKYYYVRLYGLNTVLRSVPFILTGSSFVFSGQTMGSGTKILRLCKADSNCSESDDILIEESYTEKSPWRAYAIDISDYDGQKAYIELSTEDADTAAFMADDFIMKQSDASDKVVVSIVSSNTTWQASPGAHTITVRVDSTDEKDGSTGEITEPDETNNEEISYILREDGQKIEKADYEANITKSSPKEQVQGRGITFTALVQNIEYTSAVESELQWFYCLEETKGWCDTNDNWQTGDSETMAGLNGLGSEGDSYTGTYTMEVESVPKTYSPGSFGDPDGYTIKVKAVADYTGLIDETLEYTKNVGNSSVFIYHPDLVITDIWWIPEHPLDGEETIFYAQIENWGIGGTIQDFDVSFVIDEELIDQITIKDEILPAGRGFLGANLYNNGGDVFGDFENISIVSRPESGDISTSTWTRFSGNVLREARYDTADLPSKKDRVKNKYYAVMSGSDAVLLSPEFTLNGDSLFFNAQSSGSGTKKLLIRELAGTSPSSSSDKILIEKEYTEKSPWRAYIVDISDYNNKNVYLELRAEDSSNAVFMVDDFRMAKANCSCLNGNCETDGCVVVSVAVSTKAWEARPFEDQDITVSVDITDNIYELASSETSYSSANFKGRSLSRTRSTYYVSKTRNNKLRSGEDNNSLTKQISRSDDPGDPNNKEKLTGDINNNQKVDIIDALIALQISLGIEHDNIDMESGDVDNNGRIDIVETIYILRKLAEF